MLWVNVFLFWIFYQGPPCMALCNVHGVSACDVYWEKTNVARIFARLVCMGPCSTL